MKLLPRVDLFASQPAVVVATSGGSDSIAAAHFLHKGGRKVVLAFFDHLIPSEQHSKAITEQFANQHQMDLVYGKLPEDFDNIRANKQEVWRTYRNQWLQDVSNQHNKLVVTGHNLDDCIETWMFSSIRGQPKLIPWQNQSIIRPFLMTTKLSLQQWCVDHNLGWVDDPTNVDTSYDRNYIRHVMMPHVNRINPGIAKVIRKKLLQKIAVESTQGVNNESKVV